MHETDHDARTVERRIKEQAEPDPEEGNGRRAMDPELLVMSRCLRIIEDLSPAGQRRVLNWLCDRCHGNGLREALANGVGA